MGDKCLTEDCGMPSRTRGRCDTHYRRLYRSGLIQSLPKRTAADRFWAKVDKSGECWLWTGGKVKGYGHFYLDGKRLYSHRISYEMANGPIEDGKVIDHICHTPACVNPAHLRACTHKQNQEHRVGAAVNSRSGVRGVHRCYGKWRAQIRHNMVTYYLGLFDDIEEAARVVTAKRNELFTHNDADRKK